MVASRKNPDVQVLYERLVDAGKPKMCALGACYAKVGAHLLWRLQEPAALPAAGLSDVAIFSRAT
jgi:hypothetical protein